ncbi:MAG: DUF4836 family protein [Bacteroidales bacterium]
MKKIPIIVALTLLITTLSCSRKTSDSINSIPDHASLVASVHPDQIYNKGQVGSLESLTKSVRNEFMRSIVKDPLKSGIDMSEYIYLFVYFIDDEPVMGITADLKNHGKFKKMIEEINKNDDQQIISHKGYSMITPEGDEAALAWNEKQVILLASPQKTMTADDWQTELTGLYEQRREQSISSVVDFRNFAGKMKDINVWITGDDLKKILAKTKSLKDLEFDVPVNLDNNYNHVFVEFADGAMNIHSEMHLSDDAKKVTETLQLTKENLNRDLLTISPGNDLLMALAFSVKTDRVVKLIKKFNPPQAEGMSDKIEKATGVPGSDILDALNGDFVLAVNGAPEGSALPVEVLIGMGLDDETLQEKLLGSVGNMAQVEKEGDFFTINAVGMELYSGIVKGIWIITNVPGYKDAIAGKGLDQTLSDSKFKDYTGGSMGMYMNLDLTTYPAGLQSMMASRSAPKTLELLTESFDYIGMESSNYENNIILKTSKEKENSLYTVLRLMESFQVAN